jgi:hypothetical protein
MELIGEAIVAMRDAPEPRITVEVALIRCTHPEADTSPDALVERIERLEHRLEALTASGATAEARPAPPPPPPLPPPLGETPRPAPPRRDGPPGPPASTDAATRPALGAFLRGDRPGATAPDTRGPDTRGPDTKGPDTKGPDSAPLPVAEDVAPTARPTVEPVGASDDTRSTGGGEPPSYDELVTAWGDHILTGLRPKVRAIYQVGHFLPSSGGHALLALPNEAHILHAEPLKADVAAALASHFGRAVPLRLVVDPATSAPPEARSSVGGRGSRPSRSAEAGGAGSAPSESSESEEDLTDLGTPLRAEEEAAVKSSGIAWAEDRLLQAFPGAEEV